MASQETKLTLMIISCTFVILSVLELIFLLILSLTEININNENILILDLLFDGNFVPIEGLCLFIFIAILPFCFLIFGFMLFKIALTKDIDNMILAKYLSKIGLFILIATFIKVEFYLLLSKVQVNYNSNTFQSLLYSHDIVPITAAMIWMFFSGVFCSHLVGALVIAGGGLKWRLDQERKERELKEVKEG